jgi:hypothetical protein
MTPHRTTAGGIGTVATVGVGEMVGCRDLRGRPAWVMVRG